MNQIMLQAVLAVGSWIGVPIGWLSGYGGKRRIKQPLAGIITNVGPMVMVVPWVLMPFLAQPHFIGLLSTWTLIAGILSLLGATLLTIWAMPYIFPSAKKGGDELDPEFLVVNGPYRWIRHPLYTGGVTALIGLALLRGGLYSLLLSPICYLLFRFEAYLEETRVLEPKFGDEFRQFKRRVPVALFGRIGTIVLLLIYLAFVCMVVLGKVATG